jgi:hypothetical protein
MKMILSYPLNTLPGAEGGYPGKFLKKMTLTRLVN